MSYSTAFRAQLGALDDSDGFLMLLLITSPDMSTPVYLVADNRDWSIGGINYTGMPMDVTMPTDVPGEASRAQIEIPSAGRELIAELEAMPLGAGLEVALRIVSRARPEQIEYEFVASVSRITATAARVVVSLGDDAILRQSAVLLRFDPLTSPKLFAG